MLELPQSHSGDHWEDTHCFLDYRCVMPILFLQNMSILSVLDIQSVQILQKQDGHYGIFKKDNSQNDKENCGFLFD